MRSAAKRSSKRARHAARSKASRSASAATACVLVLDDPPGQARLDDLGHRAAPVRDHGRAARHRLDHHQAEGLRPVDRERGVPPHRPGTPTCRARRSRPRTRHPPCRASAAPRTRSRRYPASPPSPRSSAAAPRGARCGSPGRDASPARCGRGTRGSRHARFPERGGRAAGRGARSRASSPTAAGGAAQSEMDTSGASS